MKKASKAFEAIKTISIALLFAMAIIMVFMHFYILQKKNEVASGASDFRNTVSLNSDESSVYNSLSPSSLLPSAVAVKNQTGELAAITSSSDYMGEVYSIAKPDISFMLSNKCIAERLSDSAEFDRALSGESFIYISYHGNLPGILIYLHTLDNEYSSASLEIGNLTNSVFLKELIIFQNVKERDAVFALSRSQNGEVFSYKIASDKQINMHTDDFDIYSEASAMTAAEFYGINEFKILPSTIVYSLPRSSYKISISKEDTELSTNTPLQIELANMLDINPDKTGSYFDEALGGTVYMATHGNLTICNDSIIYSTANNIGGGVSLSFYSGKATEEPHTMYEIMAIAESIVNSLNTSDLCSPLLGGEAEPQITALYRNGDQLVLEYGYFYDNVPISDMEVGVRLKMSASKLTGFELFPINVKAIKSEQQQCIAPAWALSITKGNISEDGLYTIVYKYASINDNDYEAEWIPTQIIG